IRRVRTLDRAKFLNQLAIDVFCELSRHLRSPVRKNALRIEGRELLLDFVRELKIQGVFAPGAAFAQKGHRFARVLIAIVIKKNNFTSDAGLEAACGHDLTVQKTLGEKPAGLLTETNDRL